MRFAIYTGAGLAALMLLACGPTFNWRETPISDTQLTALFPCKPKMASRRLPLGGADVELQMTGCDTGGVTFGVGHAAMPTPGLAGPALVQWRETTLAGIRPKSSNVTPLRLAGALEIPQSVRITAVGSKPDGAALALQAAWFTRDNQVFGALAYGESLSPEVAEAFFAGLKFR